MKRNGNQKLVAQALSELHRKSTEPTDAQWFTRAQIGQQLNIVSGHLNPARVGALRHLVETNQVSSRFTPDDKRQHPQYQINPEWEA